MSKKALILVDLQNDFCPGGNLAVEDGDKVIPIANKLSASKSFDFIIATQDWHPKNHASFASVQGKKVNDIIDLDGQQQVMWPDHCVQGTKGADFNPDLDLGPVHLIIRKGHHERIDSYSAFLENDKKTETGLHYYLQGHGVTEVYICGLATDYCVFYSALDSQNFGFHTTIIEDACRAVNFPENSLTTALQSMQEKGIKIIRHEQL